jgi:hypothetical protein
MDEQIRKMRELLLSYVGLLAERHLYAPGDNFEYVLWDDLLKKNPELVDREEKAEIVTLIIRTDAWVTFDVDSGMFALIDIDAWRLLLQKRGHSCHQRRGSTPRSWR